MCHIVQELNVRNPDMPCYPRITCRKSRSDLLSRNHMLGSQTQPVRQGLYARNPDVAHQPGAGRMDPDVLHSPRAVCGDGEQANTCRLHPARKCRYPAGSCLSSETDKCKKQLQKQGLSRASHELVVWGASLQLGREEQARRGGYVCSQSSMGSDYGSGVGRSSGRSGDPFCWC